MESIPNSRSLEERHLLLVAEAETKAMPNVAKTAHEIWSLHELAIAALEDLLARAR